MIDRRRTVGVVAGLAGLALAAGAAALAVSSGGGIANNWIGAGHLVLKVNGSTDPVDVGVDNLAPGQQGSVEELVTADMGGVPAGALTLTVSAPAGVAATDSTLQISFTDPVAVASLGWTGSSCANATFSHTATAQQASSAPGAALGTIGPGQGVCVRFGLGLSSSAGNSAQGTTTNWSISYHLEQTVPGPAQTEAAAP